MAEGLLTPQTEITTLNSKCENSYWPIRLGTGPGKGWEVSADWLFDNPCDSTVQALQVEMYLPKSDSDHRHKFGHTAGQEWVRKAQRENEQIQIQTGSQAMGHVCWGRKLPDTHSPITCLFFSHDASHIAST